MSSCWAVDFDLPTHSSSHRLPPPCYTHAGVISSSLGSLLKTQGLRVTSIKIDPYLNIDAVRMSPPPKAPKRAAHHSADGFANAHVCPLARSLARALTRRSLRWTGSSPQGTFSPYEHGETYVLDDGGEVDLDLGNYERFLDITLHRDNNITTGKIYQVRTDLSLCPPARSPTSGPGSRE